MARKFTASKAQLKPDPRFGSKLVSKFVNCLMHDGKKSVAQRVFYEAMELIEEAPAERESPLDVFNRARRERDAGDRSPLQASRRCHLSGPDAGPQEPPADPGDPLALALRPREEGPPDGDQALGRAPRRVQSRRRRHLQALENVHRMADANKAFAHFAW